MVADFASSVAAAAAATLPCCQAVRKVCAAVVTSVAERGPDGMSFAFSSADVVCVRSSAAAPPPYSA